jgi:suppressor of fused-like protein
MNPRGARLAIEAALKAHYPGRQPTSIIAALGPLEEILVYPHPRTAKDPEHWHFVTLGLSELGAKKSADASKSGWGFELTLRVERAFSEGDPPRWPARALVQLAGYVYESRTPLREGHHMNLGGPLDDDAAAIRGLAFRRDPELGEMNTPNGSLEFLQVVGVTGDEESLLARWSVSSFLDVLAIQTPLLVVSPLRRSLMEDPVLGPTLEARAAAEGSAEAAIHAETLSWNRGLAAPERISVFLGPANAARRSLAAALDGRVAVGRPLRIVGGGRTLSMSSAEASAWEDNGDVLGLEMSRAMTAELMAFLETSEPTFESKSLPGFTLVLVD